MELNLIAISVQAVGTLLTAALLWQLTRVIPGRFLRYWSAGWAALAAAFSHFGPVLYWAVYVANVEPEYLTLAPVYDALGELGLAFGMLLLTTERVQAELEEKNRRLAEATEELARAARTDALTGLLNRRAYEELLAEPAGRADAGSLAVIDLNDLKPLNDTRGHHAGDAAPQLVARSLRVHFRVTHPP